MAHKLDLSRKLQQRAEQLIPGGVNSPVRAFRAVGGEPPFLVRGQGAYVYDADGNSYIDYVGSWGPLLLGHAAPEVVEAVIDAARKGTSFGASTPSEIDLAEAVIEAFPSIGKLRFVSSGTEATMSAIRLARAATGRKYIIKFIGCYHGHTDALLVKAGSGVATLGIPGSAGVPEEFVQFTLALPYNDPKAVEAAFDQLKRQIACIIVEPVVGNMGCVLPQPGYLKFLRDITRREGALLIFDEVMTGFRVAYGGAQELYKITPDLTTLGKIIGGGLPVGAYGGATEIMNLVAPLGPMYQAGTLSGNPLAMAAGIAMLCTLRNHRHELYPRLEKLTTSLVNRVCDAAREAGISNTPHSRVGAEAGAPDTPRSRGGVEEAGIANTPHSRVGVKAGIGITANHVGSMFTFFFTDRAVTDWDSAAACDTERFGRFHRAMLNAGVWLPPSQFEAAFLSAAHTEQEIDQTVAAAREALAQA